MIIMIITYQMDKLLVALLGFSFIFGNSGLTSAGLLALLFSGAVPLNHITLVSLTYLITYYFYGLYGLFYFMTASLSMITCGAMYWFELSVADIKQNANNLKFQANENSSEFTDSSKSTNLTEFDKKLAVLTDLKTHGINSFCQKSGLTPEHIVSLKGYYNVASTQFNMVCDVIYGYMCQFRETTKNIAVLTTIYYAYDQIWVYKKNIETVRSLHKITKNMDSLMGDSIHRSNSESQNAINLDTDNSISKKENDMVLLASMNQLFDDIKSTDMEMMMNQIFENGDLAHIFDGMTKMTSNLNDASFITGHN